MSSGMRAPIERALASASSRVVSAAPASPDASSQLGLAQEQTDEVERVVGPGDAHRLA